MIRLIEPGERDVYAEIRCLRSPVGEAWAERLEWFFVKMFEYGHVGFRALLRGEYADDLECVIFAAEREGEIAGAAGCLYPCRKHAIALLGPVGVAEEYRWGGLGRRLVQRVTGYLREKEYRRVYAGVKRESGAYRFYRKMGFQSAGGIILQFDLERANEEGDDYFAERGVAQIRAARWGDYCGVQGLFAAGSSMYTFDLEEGLFSTRYAEAEAFMPIFPNLMRSNISGKGGTYVLTNGESENVTGIGWFRRGAGMCCEHMGKMEFFVHDHFQSHAENLLEVLLEECGRRKMERVYCTIAERDEGKRTAAERCGGMEGGRFVRRICIAGEYQDAILYEWALR